MDVGTGRALVSGRNGRTDSADHAVRRRAPWPVVPPRHDRDAGGDPDLLAAKAARREDVWRAMAVPGIRRFPSPEGRIPNFVGAEAAADRLAGTQAWRTARTIKANPDAPQLPVRVRALEEGKTVYMAVPRLASEDPFFLLDPDTLADPPRKAATIAGASRSARRAAIGELEPVDLVVAGCVAVGRDGARLGKGGGFSDLELALAAAAGLVGEQTVVVTTVHPVQVLGRGEIPTTAHDVHVDLIATPDEVIACRRSTRHALPSLLWEELTAEKIDAIPLLRRMAAEAGAMTDRISPVAAISSGGLVRRQSQQTKEDRH
jgi:5-formyltetrahydrofolate cyclo-ligase